MIKNESSGIRFFQFELFPDEKIIHGVVSRKGGVSPAPWDSLNLGGSVGDEISNVEKNLELLLSSIQAAPQQLAQVQQIHSNKIVPIRKPNELSAADLPAADGMVTSSPGVLLLMRFADCVPVLLFDPEKEVIGLVHAGWKGTLKKAAAAAVELMIERYHSAPEDILAGIGPSIGPDHYRVGDDVLKEVRQAFPDRWNELIIEGRNEVKLDLWTANRYALEDLKVTKIEVAEICTACNLEDWYSHRAEKGRTGRFGALLMLK